MPVETIKLPSEVNDGSPATGMQTAMRHGGRADLGPGEGGRENKRRSQRVREPEPETGTQADRDRDRVERSKEQGGSEISRDKRQGHRDTGSVSKRQKPKTQRERETRRVRDSDPRAEGSSSRDRDKGWRGARGEPEI